MATNRAKGTQGSWYATVTGPDFAIPVLLPAAHQHWIMETRPDGMDYEDPGLQAGRDKAEKYAADIRKAGLVILHKSKIVGEDENGHPKFARDGYVAVFTVPPESVILDEKSLRFRMTAPRYELR